MGGVCLSDAQLSMLSRNIGQEWKSLALEHLGLTTNDIYHCQYGGGALMDHIFNMLKMWADRARNEATVDVLVSKLRASGVSSASYYFLTQGTMHHRQPLGIGDKYLMLQKDLKQFYIQRFGIMKKSPITIINNESHSISDIYSDVHLEIRKSHGKKHTLKNLSQLFSVRNPGPQNDRATRILLSGKPGSGKTTLTQKLVVDWATGKVGSCLQNTSLVIMLPLRYFQRNVSLSETVHSMYLPRDTMLTPADIESIIHSHRDSLVVILDGYDEYVSADVSSSSSSSSPEGFNVHEIISCNQLRSSQVLVTTRTSLTKSFDDLRMYVHLELTGFTDSQIITYIEKHALKDRPDLAEHALNYLMTNDMLKDVRKVPLFVALTCDLLQLAEDMLPEAPDRLSSILYYFCFGFICNHKLKQKSEDKYDPSSYETFSVLALKALGKVAMDGLLGPLTLTWKKLNFLSAMEQEGNIDFYKFGIEVGLIVEDSLVAPHHSGHLNQTLFPVITSVSFFHKVFQEKVAAFYLSELAKDDEDEFLKELGRIQTTEKVLELGYMLHFTCGESFLAAKGIITHLYKYFKGIYDLRAECLFEAWVSDVTLPDILELGHKPSIEQMDVNCHDVYKRRVVLCYAQYAAAIRLPVDVNIQNCEEGFLKEVIMADSGFLQNLTIHNLRVDHNTFTDLRYQDNLSSILFYDCHVLEKGLSALLAWAVRMKSLTLIRFKDCGFPAKFLNGTRISRLLACDHLLNVLHVSDENHFHLVPTSGQWQEISRLEFVTLRAESMTIRKPPEKSNFSRRQSSSTSSHQHSLRTATQPQTRCSVM